MGAKISRPYLRGKMFYHIPLFIHYTRNKCSRQGACVLIYRSERVGNLIKPGLRACFRAGLWAHSRPFSPHPL
jgi:hypothetical protein